MSFTLFSFVALLIGVLFYGAIVFWSGKRGNWLLAVIVTLPAIMGGLMSFGIDMSQSSSPLFRNFQWLVLGQILFGLVVYRFGSSRAPAANENLEGIE